MIDRDTRAEDELQPVPAEQAPADAPAALRDAAADAPRQPPSRSRSTGGRAFAMLAIAAAAVLAVAAVATVLRLGGDQPSMGGLVTPMPSISSTLHLEYQVVEPDPTDAGPLTLSDVEAVAEVLRARIDPTGIAESSVTVVDGNRIVVGLAVPADDESVTGPLRALLGTTGRLDFVPLRDTQMQTGDTLDPGRYPPLFSGDQLADAKIGSDQTGQRTIDFTLRPDGAALFAAYTGQHIGDYFAIAMDGKVMTAPIIMSPIPDGKVQVSGAGEGGWPLDEAQRLVTIVKSGKLPFSVQEVASNTP